MIRLLLLTSVVILIPFLAKSQNEANVWYFGTNAGISFNTSAPTPVSGSLVSAEGSAAISSPSGQLLFYTNGITVWNRNHLVMSNGSGLLGDDDATQSCIVIPKPGTKNLYYIFTLDNFGGSNGLRYSEVNTSLAGGLGEVTNKNVPLESPLSEKLTAVRHDNGTDYWVLAHGINNNSFFVYHVSSTGITATTTNIGSSHPSLSTGYMKFSPNGKKIACAINSSKTVELFDFDNKTGSITNVCTLGFIANPYGIEFSPDNSKLYVSAGKIIYQYTIPATYNPAQLALSEKTILSDFPVWALQAGPDKKIYVCKSGNTLGVLNSPNDALNAGFIEDYLTLPNDARQGLPNSMSHLFNESFIEAENTCAGQPTQFKVLLNGLDSIRWDFGTFPVGTGSVQALRPQFTYTVAGTYTVKATVYNKGYSQTFSTEITINALPSFSLGTADTTLCKGQYLSYNINISGATYLWSNGSRLGKNVITTPGMHWLEVTANGCKAKKNITATYEIVNPDFSISKDVQCLQGNVFEFSSTTPGSPLLTWKVDGVPGSGNPKITTSFTVPGVKEITLFATTQHCKDSIQKEVIVNENPKASFDIRTVDNCGANNSFEIKDKSKYSGSYTVTYEIENKNVGQSNFTYSFSGPGQYKVKQTVKTAEGCTEATEKSVQVFEAPSADFSINTISSCEGDNRFGFTKTITLQSYETITWYVDNAQALPAGRSTTLNAKNLSSGRHTIKAVVKNTTGCEAAIEKQVEVVKKPAADFSTAENRLNCVGSSPVKFINLSASEHPINKTSWDFGDLTTSTDNEPVKQYTAQNTYLVTLKVQNDKGCEAIVSKTISTYENPAPQVSATIKNACETNNLFELTYSNTNLGAVVDNFTWTGDNGKTVTNQNPAFFSFTTTGDHTIDLVATTAKGCNASAKVTVKVQPNPKAVIEVNNATQCFEQNKVDLLARITLGGGVVKNITWDFGDGNTQANVYDPKITYAQAGIYPVKLLLEDEYGCTAEETLQVEILPSPMVNIESVKGCSGQPVKLKINGLQSGIAVADWQWSLGDGNIATVPQHEYTYEQPGDYNLGLTVTTDKGCSHITSLAGGAQIAPTPVVNFEYEKTYWSFDETVINFKALTSIPGKNYKWDFGNGKTGIGANLQVKYDKADYYTVKLEVETPKGCSNSISHKILVVPPFDAYVPTSFTPNGDGKNDFFGMEGVEFITTFEMTVVNRWGQEVFFSDDLKLKWDGNFNGTPLPPDMYSYKIDIKDAENRPYTLKGTLQLIR